MTILPRGSYILRELYIDATILAAIATLTPESLTTHQIKAASRFHSELIADIHAHGAELVMLAPATLNTLKTYCDATDAYTHTHLVDVIVKPRHQQQPAIPAIKTQKV